MSRNEEIRARVEEGRRAGGGFLNLSRLELNRLPDELAECKQWLRELAFTGNNIEEINEADAALIEELDLLGVMDLTDNKIATFPQNLESRSLVTLILDRNGIEDLKIGSSRLPALRYLSATRNGIVRVDPDIVRLANLEMLDLSGNVILDLPDTIGSMRRLRELVLGENPGLLPPTRITQLDSLRLLDLNNNFLTHLPEKLGRLPKNITLRLDGNFFEESLQALLNEDTQTILRYLLSLRETQANSEAKLLLVGEGNVGKTSLVEALRNQPFIENRETTHGIEINTVDVPNGVSEQPAVIKLRSWDFGGQEVYRITHQFFFSPRSIYLVVWRPREGQDENAVEPWIRRIRLRIGSDTKVIVVATHGEERRAEIDREVLGQRFGSMLAGFAVVDSKTAYGLERLRELLGGIAGALPQIGEPLNVKWMEARDELLSLGNPCIRRSKFDRICASHEIDEEDADILAKLLADLGYIVYYPDDDGLKDILVLQPEWLTKAISHVLEDSSTRDAGGVLDHYRLNEIWTQQAPYLPDQLHRYVLRLMEKFDVSYRIPDSNMSLVGQLVPYERPEFQWTDQDPDHPPLVLECEFGERLERIDEVPIGDPPGLIAWLIVRNHRFSIGKHWRRGVFLRHPDYLTEGLYELVSPTLLRLHVRGEARGFFFDILRDTLTHLFQSRWPGLIYRLYVTCPGATDTVTACRGRFPLRSLELLRERDEESVTCIECLESWEVNELLSGWRVQRDAVAQLIHTEFRALRDDLEKTLLSTRALFKAMATEVTDCPRLFAVSPVGELRGGPRQMFTRRYRLTLWCEEQGGEHPVAPSYTFRKSREWFADVAPYLHIAARIIALLSPGVGAASAMLAGEQTDTKRVSDFMKALADSSTDVGQASFQPTDSGLTRSEGAAIRRFRELLLELDSARDFAGLRRVLSPTGDFLWVCPAHHGTYEPGLPEIPPSRRRGAVESSSPEEP